MKAAVLIDGGHLRICAKTAGKDYDPAFIERFALGCVQTDEYLLRVLYYDSPQYRGKVQLPVSGGTTNFQANDNWLRELAKKDRFAVRRGTLAFRGWTPKSVPVSGKGLQDSDFKPNFEQKGVDMRLGLDIATISDRRSVDRIIVVSADTDMIPAMKHARKAGIEIVIVETDPCQLKLHDQLLAHADEKRIVKLP